MVQIKLATYFMPEPIFSYMSDKYFRVQVTENPAGVTWTPPSTCKKAIIKRLDFKYRCLWEIVLSRDLAVDMTDDIRAVGESHASLSNFSFSG